MGRWSNASFTMLLKMLKEELLPNGANLPNSYYEAKKIRLMLVLMIRCYTGRRIAYSILANQPGKTVGAKDPCELESYELEQGHLYILNNCDEVLPYIKEFAQTHENAQHLSAVDWSRQFIEWFKDRVAQLHKRDDSQIMEDLLSLSRGPTKYSTRSNGYVVNGYRFHVEDYDTRKGLEKRTRSLSSSLGISKYEVRSFIKSADFDNQYMETPSKCTKLGSNMSSNQEMQKMKKIVLEKEDMQTNVSLPLYVIQVMNHSQTTEKCSSNPTKHKFESVDMNDHRDHILGWMNRLWNK
ncbi:hypothetical protein RDI58_001112 [Solanum bulbocastanum]|uniref:Uncharacterized protein n=1 Tax=Solanum bulbocastanum TaxID=147425 RepID=A0AAN8U8X2_SOLBU